MMAASTAVSTVASLGTAPSAIAEPVGVGKQTSPPRDENHRAKIIFQPHRAVYEVTLERTSAGSAIAGLAGRMVYQLSGNSCQGYTQKLRFLSRTSNQNGEARLSDLRSTSWENSAATTLRFDVQNFYDADLAEASKGVAARDIGSGKITVNLNKPELKKVTLSGTTLFPIAHSKAVLRAARAGQTIFPSAFYDGSETGEKVYQTTAVIGKLRAGVAVPSADKAPSPHALADSVTSWPIAMSYYERADSTSDGRPSFEMSYRFHLNGVTSKFVIDHGDFALSGKLSQLIFNVPAGCDDEQPRTP